MATEPSKPKVVAPAPKVVEPVNEAGLSLEDQVLAHCKKLSAYLESQAGQDGKNPFLWDKDNGYSAMFREWEATKNPELGKKLLALPTEPDCSVAKYDFNPGLKNKSVILGA